MFSISFRQVSLTGRMLTHRLSVCVLAGSSAALTRHYLGNKKAISALNKGPAMSEYDVSELFEQRNTILL